MNNRYYEFISLKNCYDLFHKLIGDILFSLALSGHFIVRIDRTTLLVSGQVYISINRE